MDRYGRDRGRDTRDPRRHVHNSYHGVGHDQRTPYQTLRANAPSFVPRHFNPPPLNPLPFPSPRFNQPRFNPPPFNFPPPFNPQPFHPPRFLPPPFDPEPFYRHEFNPNPSIPRQVHRQPLNPGPGRAPALLQRMVFEQPHREFRVATNNRGEPYPVDEEDLVILQSPVFGPQDPLWRPLPRPVSMEEAYDRLFSPHPIERTVHFEEAWDRIDSPRHGRLLTWDFLVKIFNDIDTAVFHGHLRRRVHLKWVDMRRAGFPHHIGMTMNPPNWETQRITILLGSNWDYTQFPPGYALGLMMHEMLHAYFAVWCGNATGEMEFDPDWDRSHGRIFMAAARRIERETGKLLTKRPDHFVVDGRLPDICGNANLSMYQLERGWNRR